MDRLAHLNFESDEGVVIARVDGDIDTSNAQDVGDALLSAMTNDTVGLVLDLSSLDYLDSSGVHLILGLQVQLRQRRKQLRVVAPAEAPLRTVLELTAVDKAVPLDERAAEAVRAIRVRVGANSGST